MEETHDHHHEKDSFEPLKQEFYEGKHLSAPVKEIEVKYRHIHKKNTNTKQKQ